MTTILRDNLECALFLAIKILESQGSGKTIACEGYRQNLAALRRGEAIEVLENPTFTTTMEPNEIEKIIRAGVEPEIQKQVERVSMMIKNAAEAWHVAPESIKLTVDPHIVLNPGLTAPGLPK